MAETFDLIIKASMGAKAWPMVTLVLGVMVMCDGALVAPGRGEPVRFVETLVQA